MTGEKKQKTRLNSFQKDALSEISNITTGNATIALSKLINKNVKISIPRAVLMNKGELSKSMGGSKKMVMSIYSRITGDITGQVLFFFKRTAAMQLVDLLVGREQKSTKVLDSYSESAFGEMANIFTGSYLNALSKMLDIRILPGIPVIATDYVGPIIDYLWGRIENPGKKMFCFTTNIAVDGHNIDGDFVFMLDMDSYDLVLEKLEKKYGIKKKATAKNKKSANLKKGK
ncbi:MAG: chemotaxis protein CheC [Nanobdellota archaeon]